MLGEDLASDGVIRTVICEETDHERGGRRGLWQGKKLQRTAILDGLMAHLVLRRQLVTVRASVSPVASTLRVERANVRAIALVARILTSETLEEILPCTVRLAELECARRSLRLSLFD